MAGEVVIGEREYLQLGIRVVFSHHYDDAFQSWFVLQSTCGRVSEIKSSAVEGIVLTAELSALFLAALM